MKTAEEFLSVIEGRGTATFSRPAPLRNHPSSSAIPPDVVQAASLKWRLFPVQQPSNFDIASALAEEATSDCGQLERWATEYVGCAWALAIGQKSGVFVVEMNGELGRKSFCDLGWNEWDWEQTLQSVAGGTAHAFFRWPVGLSWQTARKQIAPGLTVRGEGDFVLIPPSVVSGTSHAWRSPDAHLADAPMWLLDSIFAVPAGQVSREKSLCFPNVPLQIVVPSTPSPRSPHAKLLPFIGPASSLGPNARRRVYVSVQFHAGTWCCRFVEKDLPRGSRFATLTLPTAAKLIALIGRGDGLSDQANRDALFAAILNGSGRIFVDLTGEQYAKLTKYCRSRARA